MTISLEQLQAFVASAEKGSFSAAGRYLGKAQSAVSTAVMNLEIDLGLQLFDRSAKSPVLTEHGVALLRDADYILKGCEGFMSRAVGLAEGMEQRVTLIVDDLVIVDGLKRLLRLFDETFPFVEVELLQASLADAGKMVASGRADIGIMAPIDFSAEGYHCRLIDNVSFVPAVSVDHDLAALETVSLRDLEPHRQIAETSRSGDREPPDYILSHRVWYAESLRVICDLIRAGLCWGIVPENMIETDLRKGRLKKLSLESAGAVFMAPVYLVWSKKRRLGNAGMWLLETLKRERFWG